MKANLMCCVMQLGLHEILNPSPTEYAVSLHREYIYSSFFLHRFFEHIAINKTENYKKKEIVG